MDQKELWQAALEQLRRTAAKNHYHVTVGDIVECFDGIELTRDNVAQIYRYAAEKNIVIDDYQPHDTRHVTVTATEDDGEQAFSEGKENLSGAEKEYFREFMRELRLIEAEEEGEMGWLLERLLEGDDSVMNRLVEINLRSVLDIAKRSAGHGVPLGDLVQEGNLALVSAIDDYRLTGQSALEDEFRQHLRRKVTEAVDAAVGEETNFAETAEKLARDANRLLTVTRELEEALGRAATLEELAKKMDETEEYIQEVMRISQAVMDNAAAKNQRI